jgi:putative membrane protein
VVTASIVGGLLGGLLGAVVMSVAHAVGAPMVLPPAPPSAQGDDATVKVADALSRAVRGRPVAGPRKPAAGSAVHYGFGATMGALYGVVAVAVPTVTAGTGLGFGAALWVSAHAIIVPALGLAPAPLRQPLRVEIVELVLHLLYGVTAELVRRAALTLV